jgi:hypothetical protein
MTRVAHAEQIDLCFGDPMRKYLVEVSEPAI